MRPTECHIGDQVMYFPSRHGPGFVGTVAREPWQLWCGTWVTKLTDMQPEYAEFTHKSGDKATTVFAASLESCESIGYGCRLCQSCWEEESARAWWELFETDEEYECLHGSDD